jgi:hypothetical protein
MPTVKIPSSLFDTLQSVFKLEAKRICKDVAKILQKPEKEVLDKVFQSQIILQVLEDHEETLSCPVFLKHETVIERCRVPCILGTGRCLKHQTFTSIPELPSTVQRLTRIECTADTTEPLWCDEMTDYVYNTSGAHIGWYTNERLTLVEFEDDK